MKAAALSVTGLLFMQPCERPPVQYQGDTGPAVILFAEPATVDQVCREAIPNMKGDPRQILACTHAGNRVMLMPDPCLYEDGYAKLLCHEKSHLNGWVHG